jgi:hypothetical protein
VPGAFGEQRAGLFRFLSVVGLLLDQRKDSDGVFERGRPLMTSEPSRAIGTQGRAVN